MTRVLCSVNPIQRSYRLGRLLLGHQRISRPYQIPPPLYSIPRDELHPHHKIRRHKLNQGPEEPLAPMLSIEPLRIGHGHPEHLEIPDLEVLFGCRDYLPDVEVGVGFYHAVGAGLGSCRTGTVWISSICG